MSDITAPAARGAARLHSPGPWSARRTLQTCLGLIWLLDAALQFQPYMFSRDFVTNIIEPTAAGNPAVIAAPITWSARIMASHIVPANAAFAVIQLAIAAWLLLGRAPRLALAASIAWAAAVWWFGEGLGAILTGGSPLAGLPGAVILYALIAVLIWPARDDPGTARLSPALRGPLGPFAAEVAWLVLWAGFACYLILPANRAPGAISQDFTSMAAGQPGWVRFIQQNLAAITAGHGLAASLAVAAACALAGAGIFADRLTRPAVALACLLGLLFWAAEGFGGITTGQATDPNSGPLLILLAACYWPPGQPGAAARRRLPAPRSA
jgi:hypothetical protein